MGLYAKLKSMKIIVVEDDQWIQNGLRMYFQHRGCELVGFENAAPAIEYLSRERADIILCDYWLPDLDGLTLFQRVKAKQPEALWVLITAYPSDDLQENALRQGIHDFLPKPLTIRKIEACLEALVDKYRAGGEVAK